MMSFDTLQALQEAVLLPGQIVQMKGYSAIGDGGGGEFTYTLGNFSAEVAADTAHGVHVPLDSDLTGASGACIRSLVGIDGISPDWFGGHNYDGFMAAYAYAPDTHTVVISKPLLHTQTIAIQRRVNLKCIDGGWFQPDVGITNNAIEVTTLATNNMTWDIKIFGFENSCLNALFMDGVTSSEITAWVKTGAVGYSMVTRGCIICNFRFVNSSNWEAPLTGAAMPQHNLLLARGTTHISQCHASRYDVIFEGAQGDGIVQEDEGFPTSSLEITGTIEGIHGYGLKLNRLNALLINKLYCETNLLGHLLENCTGVTVGGGVRTASSLGRGFHFTNCRNIDVDGYSGELIIDDDCTGTVGNVNIQTPFYLENKSNAVHLVGPIDSSQFSSRISSAVNLGTNSARNIFPNPFLDVWNEEFSPVGFTVQNGASTLTRDYGVVTTKNPRQRSILVEHTGAALLDSLQLDFDPDYSWSHEQRWISLTISMLVPVDQEPVRVMIYDGVEAHLPITIPATGEWVTVNISALCVAGHSAKVWLSPYEGADYATGNYYIGAVNVVEGPLPNGIYADDGQRDKQYLTTIAFTPGYKWQNAFVGGKFYKASDVNSFADWVATST